VKVVFCKKLNLHKPRKILLIRFSSIGDIVLTSPVIRCLDKQWPNCEIHYLTKPVYGELLTDNPYIDKIHFLERSLRKTLKKIKGEQFDLIIDLHKNLRTYFLTAFANTKTISFNKINFEKWLMVNFKINQLPDKHLVNRYFDSLKPLGILNDNKGLDFYIHEDNHLNLPFNKQPYLAIAVGAKHHTKKIPIENLFKIVSKIEYPVVLLGDKNDFKTASLIENQFKSKVANYCGQINLQQSAFLIQKAKAVLTGDTALMHIAAAFNKPLFSVWGNTIPQLGMFPYMFENEKQIALNEMNIYENLNLSCRPCSKIGYQSCPKGHFKCMKNMNTTKITDDINQLK